MPSRALVLGGGGLAGIAWEIGVLQGLLDAGAHVLDADVVIGTSAGSAVGAGASATVELVKDFYEQQLTPGPDDHEMGAELDLEQFATTMLQVLMSATSPQDARAKLGALALATETVPESVRRGIIDARLPRKEWPERRLVITACDAQTGEFVTFDKDSGVELADAVAASCAVPGVWPPVTINGRRYIDGGVRSTTNADLADGYERILILAPFPAVESPMGPAFADEIAPLQRSAQVVAVVPDEAAQTAFGFNPLDPSTRPDSARAGHAQAASYVDAVRALWS
ncbi:MAG: patatin-like phospholipase family protein [Actinomycetes bacterium]